VSETPTHSESPPIAAAQAPDRRLSAWRARIALLVGLASSALFLYLAGSHLRWSELGAAFSRAEPWPWVPLAVLSYLAGHWVRGVRCRFLVRRAALLPVATATNVVVVGYAANNLLPARAGELVRAGMLAERAGIGVSQALTVTLLERVLDGLTIVGLLLLVALSLPVSETVGGALSLGSLVFGLAAAAVAVVVLAPSLLARTLPRLAGALRPRWREPALRAALGVGAGVEALRSSGGLALAAATSALVWTLEAGMFFFVLPVVGLDADLGWALLAMAITNLGILVPSSPGYIGPFEFFCAQALGLVGVASGTALAYALIVHVVFFVPITLWGVGIFTWYGVSLGQTAARARTARERDVQTLREGVPVTLVAAAGRRAEAGEAGEVGETAETGPLLAALTAAALPEDADPRALSAAVAFVGAQLRALPPHLRALLGVGLAGFAVLVALRYWRPYSALRPARRRSVFEAWAYGPVAPARQLMRPLRSTALLAYYDGDATGPPRLTGGPP
jgi:uncharacterized protein (TIRG00374 family)